MALRAHVSFPVRDEQDVDATSIAEHFAKLGYRLDEQTPNEFVFRRGNKLAALWRFDIRAFSTTLRVRSAPEGGGRTRVSCDWEVWTFVRRPPETQIPALEAEGRQLKSLLRND